MRAALITASLIALAGGTAAANVSALEVKFLYGLSDTRGTLRLDTGTLSYDPAHHEVWAVSGGVARVFNASGMQVYSFGHAPGLGTPVSVAALDDGNLVVLAREDQRWQLVRCNFRGEPEADLELSGVPAGFLDGFTASTLVRGGDRLYVVSMTAMRVLVADLEGRTVAVRDLAAEIGFANRRDELGLAGFDVDAGGNLLFTVAPLFGAYIASPDGKVTQFGKKGSAPGKFQIVADIARDEAGNVYVSDVLKSVINVFDRDLQFVTEFGFRGPKPSNLVGPVEMVVADRQVFVGQRARRGVAVFEVSGAEVASKSEHEQL
jgi:hypothetical protein